MWWHATIASIAAIPAPTTTAPSLDCLTLFGFVSVFLSITFFIQERNSRRAVLMFAICLAATAVYGFLQGAWPLGMLVAIWSGTTFYRGCRNKKKQQPMEIRSVQNVTRAHTFDRESRLSRMFGSM